MVSCSFLLMWTSADGCRYHSYPLVIHVSHHHVGLVSQQLLVRTFGTLRVLAQLFPPTFGGVSSLHLRCFSVNAWFWAWLRGDCPCLKMKRGGIPTPGPQRERRFGAGSHVRLRAQAGLLVSLFQGQRRFLLYSRKLFASLWTVTLTLTCPSSLHWSFHRVWRWWLGFDPSVCVMELS